MSESARIPAERLHAFTTGLFQALGTPQDIADVVADHLVAADLKGIASHGSIHILQYVRAIEAGGLNVEARPNTVRETKSTATIDANRGWGHYAAKWSMDLAMRKAQETGMCAVSLTHAHHIGRLGTYAQQAADEGYIGLITTGGGGPHVASRQPTPPSDNVIDRLTFGGSGAAPYGGARPALGTNPISFGCPSSDGKHFIADFATTMLSNSKVLIALLKGEKLPPGCIVDKDGNPSVEPEDYYNGGAPLVFGGYKGYAFSLLTCLLGGLGGGYNVESRYMGGDFLMAIDVRAFQPLEAYERNVAAFLDGMRSVPPAPGFTEVLVPGDPERRAEEENRREGIALHDEVLAELRQCGGKYGVEL